MGEEKYPDVIELKLKLHYFPKTHKFDKKMKKFIEIPMEVLMRLTDGKCVKGSLRRDKKTGSLLFRAYLRQKGQKDRIVCQLENGWLKESAQRYKFFNSVKKDLGRRLVDVVMHRELKQAMQVLEIEEIMDNI